MSRPHKPISEGTQRMTTPAHPSGLNNVEARIKRPKLKTEPVTWKAAGQIRIQGIGLFREGKMHAHLTPAEAYKMALRLVELADQIKEKQTKEEGTK